MKHTENIFEKYYQDKTFNDIHSEHWIGIQSSDSAESTKKIKREHCILPHYVLVITVLNSWIEVIDWTSRLIIFVCLSLW